MRRGSVLLSALLLAGFAPTTATAETALDWHPCPGNTAVECATITVPIDHARPAAGTIDVAVARVAATGKKRGTLVYLPGGPGDSGVQRLLDWDRDGPPEAGVVPSAVAERFDIVSYDPRGTNRSHPVRCDGDLVANLPNVVPDTGARLADVREYARDLGTSCREHTGPLVDHVDSVSVARDVDAIRAALGERQITLYSRSYGTVAAQMYAENFPRRVRGVVLDSVFDHSLTPTRFAVTEARAAEDSFGEFARWCADNTACALHGRDTGQVYGELWEKAGRGELPMAQMQLTQTVIGRLYEPDWPGLANRMAQLAGARVAAEPFPLASFCTDHRVRISSQQEWETLWRRQSAAAPTLRAHFAFAALSLCSAWPAQTPNPQHRTEVAAAVPPVLIMNALHDPATGYEWARSVNRQIDRSVLLTYDGSGHGITMRTDCTKAVFTNYVLDGRTPRPGTHCAAETGER